MSPGKRKYLLIDGHSLAYRAFFALPPTMTTKGGQPTNAVYGFTSMLLKVLDEEKPDTVIVAFDGPRSELKRLEVYPEYKAHRPTMPEELRPQIEMIRHLLELMKVPVMTASGHEADDVLGAVAEAVKGPDSETVIVTGDKDTLQLVGGGTRVVMTGKGITETVTYDRDAVEEKYGVPPERIPDIVGLKGDSSDNIPGVPGIGEKGGCALIKEYGSLENLYQHLGEISGPKRKSALEENRETAFMSRDLAVIDRGVPLEVDPRFVEFGRWNLEEVLDYLSALEFKTLAARFVDILGGEAPAKAAPQGGEISYHAVDGKDAGEVAAFKSEAISSGSVAVSARLAGVGFCEVELVALAVATMSSVLAASFVDGGENSESIKAIREILGAASVEKWFHDGKATLEALDKSDLTVRNSAFDVALAAYLENPSLSEYDLWSLWEKNRGGRVSLDGKAETEALQPSLLPGSEAEEEADLAVSAAKIFHLKAPMSDKLTELGMLDLFEKVEMPLMAVLKGMEETGVALNADWIRSLAADAGAAIERLEREIHELAGREFKIGSTKQLAQVLFEEMGIQPVKKTKTGYSTDASVLESLREEHEIAEKIVDYREYSKLKSTYFDVLPELVCPATGRVHCAFNQMVTATGRISSSNPNLQNIPVRTDVGKKIRSGFIPGHPGWKMLVSDYSQIELRVLAHMSEDERLIDAFGRNEDIHMDTASKILGVPREEVTPEARRIAKMVNFGIVYGMGAFGLSSRLGISREEAGEFIDKYFRTYSGVQKYIERCVAEASELGYAVTLLGRRRYIPQLASTSRQARELGERLAINTPLQGTAADIIKKAMVDVSAAIEAAGLKSRMTLQIHDELLFDAAPDEVEELRELVSERMTGVLPMKVELAVDSGVYENWGEAK